MSLKEKSVTSVLWSAAQKWGSRLIGVVVFFLLARLLTPEAIGLSSLAMAFIYFAQAVVAQGFVEAIVQREELHPDHLHTAFWANAGAGVFISVLAIVGAPWIASLTNTPALAPILRWLTVSFLLSALCSIPTAILQRDFAYKILAVRYLVGIVLGGIVGVSMAFMGYGVWSLVAQELVYRTTSTISLWAQLPWRPKLRFSVVRFRELFAFESSVVGVRSFFALNRRAYDMLIANVFGAATLGVYSLGYRLTNIVEDLISSSTSTVALSSFSRIQNDRERTKRNFYMVTQLTLLFTIPAFVGLAVVAPELIPYAFGEKWRGTIPILQLFALVGIINTTASFNYVIIKAAGRAAWSSWIVLTRAVLTILSFFVVMRFGIVAVTFAYALVEFLLSPLSLIAVSKLIGVSFVDYFKRMLGPVAGTLVMVAVIYALRYYLTGVSTTLLLASFVSFGALSYALTLRVVAPEIFKSSFAFVGHIAAAAVPKAFRPSSTEQGAEVDKDKVASNTVGTAAGNVAGTVPRAAQRMTKPAPGVRLWAAELGVTDLRIADLGATDLHLVPLEGADSGRPVQTTVRTNLYSDYDDAYRDVYRGVETPAKPEARAPTEPDLISLLTRFLEKPEVLAATLSDRQGVCLAHVGERKADAETLARHSRILFAASDVLGTRYSADPTNGMVLEFPQYALYLGRVDAEHILSLHLTDAQALNVVRYLVNRALPELTLGLHIKTV